MQVLIDEKNSKFAALYLYHFSFMKIIFQEDFEIQQGDVAIKKPKRTPAEFSLVFLSPVPRVQSRKISP
ncbi:hypothetical protein CHCC14821_0798 [Bacillus paralicheniformis]|uniref:hypothetical protein n=1 Tax=Bacillus paralicheniformis TaxID=1648923 RepID=UPI001352BEFC|nr:hypothetical protein [Bacillus paralicheniformis]TWM21379.1 hypothetical protein CHCC14821_0798 [Bacillus paralicheniformis]